MNDFILGTAGHVDHGKTELVKRLTGIDPDRLPEEKKRGLTTDLGFAHLRLPSGRIAGVVDVPGHEKFLKNMLAGVGGYDLALLVVDGREGVRAQTREHLEIIRLLSIPAGLCVITKKDLCSEEELERRKEELNEFLRGTVFDKIPPLAVSARTGEGTDELLSTLDRLATDLPCREKEGIVRLPIDRVFHKPGFGTIVTGTLLSGTVRRGEMLSIQPADGEPLEGRVRMVQTYGRETDKAVAGQRTALNLAGIPHDKLRRGQMILTHGHGEPVKTLDLLLHLLPGEKKPEAGFPVRFHAWSEEAIGRIIKIREDDASLVVRLLLNREVCLFRGDPFILRLSNATKTLGGGKVLDLPRSRRETLEKREAKDKKELLCLILGKEPTRPLSEESLLKEVHLSDSEGRRLLDELAAEGTIVFLGDGKKYLLKTALEDLKKRLQSLLSRLHQEAAYRPAWRSEELRQHFAGISTHLLDRALNELVQERAFRESKEGFRLRSFEPALDEEREKIRGHLGFLLEKARFSPPTAREIEETLASNKERRLLGEVLRYMKGTGEAVEIAPGLFFPRDRLKEAERLLRELALRQGSFTAAEARDALETSRKYAIPLLEYFDGAGVTRREGDRRTISSQEEHP